MRKWIRIAALLCLTAVLTATAGLAAEGPSGKITVWIWKGAMDGVEKAMPDFRKAFPKIEVEFLVDSKVRQKLLLGLSAAGAGLPDVSLLSTLRIPQYAKMNGFLDLRSLVTARLFPSYIIRDITYGRQLVGVPWDIGSSGTYYRRDVFAQAGLASDPEGVAKLIGTWEDYFNTGKIIKEKTGIALVTMAPNGDIDLFQAMLQQNKKDIFNKNGSPGFNNSVGIKALTYQKRLQDAGLVIESTQWEADWNQILDDGKVATIPLSVWMIGNFKGWISPEKGAGKWGVAPIPGWKEGYAAPTNWGGSSWVVPKYTKNKEAALAFVKFFASRDAVVKMMRDTGIFPGRKDAYDAPIFDEPDPYFGGQKVFRFFAEQATKPIHEVPSPYVLKAQELLGDALGLYLAGKATAEKALKDAETKLLFEME